MMHILSRKYNFQIYQVELVVRAQQLDSVAQLVRALQRNDRAAGSTPARGPVVHFHKCSWLGLKIVHNFLLKICIYKNPSNASINLYALCTGTVCHCYFFHSDNFCYVIRPHLLLIHYFIILLYLSGRHFAKYWGGGRGKFGFPPYDHLAYAYHYAFMVENYCYSIAKQLFSFRSIRLTEIVGGESRLPLLPSHP